VIRESFATELAEVTLEADPETVERKGGGVGRAGITGLVWLQSFVDRD